MKAVHKWIYSQILQLEKQLERNSCEKEKEQLETKLEEAWEMFVIVSNNMDWDDYKENLMEHIGEI
jgi:hypothetical protein